MDEPVEHRTFSSDRAVTSPQEDRFGRAQFAMRVASTIGLRTDPSSLVVGLYGPWGDGKTSVLNFIRQELGSFPLVSCLTFNPWRFDSEERLLEGFFSLLASTLDTKLNTTTESIGKAIRDYSGLLKVGHAGLSDIAGLTGTLLSTVSLDTLRDRISQILSKNHMRVVVLIDDIDRMEKSEIQAIFRLVKLTADFENTAYILAFDERMVATAVGERFSSVPSDAVEAGRNFLEKIVQVPLHLPAPKKGKLREYCFEMVDGALQDAGIKVSQEEVSYFVSTFTRNMEWKLTTPRMAVRYINSIRFSLGLLRGEVYTPDLLLIEGLRILFPQVYELIKRNADLFLNRSEEPRSSQTENGLDKRLRETLAQEAPEAVANIRRLLETMFPRTGSTIYGRDWEPDWNRSKRICSSEYFDRYFTYSIDETDISDRQLEEVLANLHSEGTHRRSINDVLSSENSGRLISKLQARVETLSALDARALASQLIDRGDIYPNPRNGLRFQNPFTQAAILVSRLIMRLPAEERTPSLLKLINDSEPLPFLAECLNRCRSDKEDGDESRVVSRTQQKSLELALAQRISCAAESFVDKPWLFDAHHSWLLLHAWRTGLGDAAVIAYISRTLQAHPSSVFDLLRSALGTAWSGSTGMPFEPKFGREAYNAVAIIANMNGIAKALEGQNLSAQAFGDEYDEQAEPATNEILGQRFLAIHQQVLKEDAKAPNSSI